MTEFTPPLSLALRHQPVRDTRASSVASKSARPNGSAVNHMFNPVQQSIAGWLRLNSARREQDADAPEVDSAWLPTRPAMWDV